MTLATLLVASAMLAPPSGRPPIGPLERVDSKLYDFRIDVSVTTALQRDGGNQFYYDLRNAPIVMPVILQGTYSRVEVDSLDAAMWLSGKQDGSLKQRTRLDPGLPHNTHAAVLPIGQYKGQTLRWQLGFRTECWSSRIDDRGAATLAWPREWPDEVSDGLAPQMYIESDDPIFAETVQRVSQGQLRMVPPYLAAKDLVRYCINEMRVTGNGVNRGAMGALHGLDMVGARTAAVNGIGGPHDLVCVCVATLRAAGIPARPVIGVEEQIRSDGETRKGFVSWAEFYLHGAGWVPFDPVEMAGKGIRQRDVRQPWPEFGTMDDLNERIPLSYFFIPPVAVETPQNPAVWGWDPRPGGDPSSRQQIVFYMASHGRGPGDPR